MKKRMFDEEPLTEFLALLLSPKPEMSKVSEDSSASAMIDGEARAEGGPSVPGSLLKKYLTHAICFGHSQRGLPRVRDGFDIGTVSK